MESFIKAQSLEPDNADAVMSFNVAYDFETIDSVSELTLSLLFDEELGELIKAHAIEMIAAEEQPLIRRQT